MVLVLLVLGWLCMGGGFSLPPRNHQQQ